MKSKKNNVIFTTTKNVFLILYFKFFNAIFKHV